jgi:hypothetical protein
VYAVALCALALPARAEDGPAAWLRYPKVEAAATLAAYREHATEIVVRGNSPVLASAREELRRGERVVDRGDRGGERRLPQRRVKVEIG